MTPIPITVRTLALLLLAVVPLQAADPLTRFFAQPGSKVTIHGATTIHDFVIQGEEIVGEVEFGAGFPTINQPPELGKTPARVEGYIPVRSLHSGSKKMDEDHDCPVENSNKHWWF